MAFAVGVSGVVMATDGVAFSPPAAPQATVTDRWTAERVEIVGVTGDGAHLEEGSRLFAPGAEVDGLELLAPDVVVEDTTVRMDEGHHSAVLIAPADGDGSIVVRSNVPPAAESGGNTFVDGAPVR
ncbi:MAG: hypothetical protein L0I24_14470 [Pseudonocardia sp.]|nr:hypothetical protein [Pseudonocardia sp.]